MAISVFAFCQKQRLLYFFLWIDQAVQFFKETARADIFKSFKSQSSHDHISGVSGEPIPMCQTYKDEGNYVTYWDQNILQCL